MIRIVVYAILIMLGYRVLRKFFSPHFGEIKDTSRPNYDPAGKKNYSVKDDSKSREIEDIDFEELD